MKKVAGLDEEKTKQVRCVKRPGLDRNSCRTYTNAPSYCTAKRSSNENRCTALLVKQGVTSMLNSTAKGVYPKRKDCDGTHDAIKRDKKRKQNAWACWQASL